MPAPSLTVRPATPRDVSTLGRMGAALLRAHYAFDPQRFIAPGADPEAGYAAFLSTQLDEPDALVAIAERDGDVVGYVYAGIEPHSWKELRDRAGFIHEDRKSVV